MKSDVLIADEDLTHRALVREIIRSMGMQIAEASDVESAEKMCAEKSQLCA